MDVRPLAEAFILLTAMASAGCAGYALSCLLPNSDRDRAARSSGNESSVVSSARRYLEIRRRLEQFMPES